MPESPGLGVLVDLEEASSGGFGYVPQVTQQQLASSNSLGIKQVKPHLPTKEGNTKGSVDRRGMLVGDEMSYVYPIP